MATDALPDRNTVAGAIVRAEGVDTRWTGIALTIMVLASLSGYSATVALNQPAGIALFFAIWLLPAALRPERVVLALRYWPLFVVPAVALLSTTWSRLPATTLRLAVELTVFTLLCVTMVRMAGHRRLFLSIVVVFGGIALGALLSGTGNRAAGGEFNLVGMFASKNQLALFCGILTYTGLAGLFSGDLARWQRVVCGCGCALGAAVGILARSVGANVATIAACVAVLALLVVGRLPTGPRRVMLAAAGCVAAIGVLAIRLIPEDDVTDLLISVGKSPGLSGRAYLWERGREAIAEHPWVGYGFQAFWTPQFEDALGLYRYGGIASETGFHFHNLMYETCVELGIVGVVAMVFVLVVIAVVALRRYDRRPDATAAFGLATIVFFAMRAPVEIDFLFVFNLGNFMMVLVYVWSRQELQTARGQPGRAIVFRGEEAFG